MRNRNKKAIHYISNLSIFVMCILSANCILYKALNVNINMSVLLINIIVYIMGMILYIVIVYNTHKGKSHGYYMGAFKAIFKAIDSITNGNFSININNDDVGNNHILKELAQKVNDMAKELKSMEDMRQEFVSNVSHEIQTPLTSIKGFAELLSDGDLSEEEKKSYLEIIKTESMRLSKLSNNLLKLSALDAETIEVNKVKYRLDKQLKNIVLSLEPQWSSKNIDFDIDCPCTVISADEELMNEVWINILNNAIKFTDSEGVISVKILKNDEKIEVHIKDSGIGINKDNLKKIYERFYVADKARKREKGGNGLGLAITKKIIDMHKFNISVKSQIGRGTEFIVLIFPVLV